jgi:galactoside O-acetyltransferase
MSSGSHVNIEALVDRHGCVLEVGEESHVGAAVCFDKEGARVRIGRRCYVTGSIFSACEINIGDDVMISGQCAVFDHDSHAMNFWERADDVRAWRSNQKNWEHVMQAPVNIQSKVWIGYRATILKGVTIGEGAVVGAASVVTRDVPPWTLVAGNPARVIRELPKAQQ